MSAVALCAGFLRGIRELCGFDQLQSGITPDGRPPPNAGKLFIAVHPIERFNSYDQGLIESYSVGVSISLRISSPWDRIWQVELVEMERIENRLRSVLHKNEQVRIWANEVIGGQSSGFVESAIYGGASAVQFVGPDHWMALAESESLGYSAGLFMTLRFVEAKRIQYLQDAT